MTVSQSDSVGTAPDSVRGGGALPREHSRWLSAQARIPRVPLTLAVAAPLLSGVLLLVQAWLLAHVLDMAIAAHVPRGELLRDIGIIVVLMLLRASLGWVSERAGACAAEQIKQRLRLALFDQLVRRGPIWTRMQASGELASAVVDQIEALDGFFSRYLSAAVSAAILPIAFAVVVLPFDWIAGLLLLVTAPLIPLFMALVGWGAEAASRRHVRAFARLSGFFADRVRGLSTLKLYGRAQAEAASVATASEAVRQRTMSVLRIAFLSSAVLEFFAALGVAGMAVYFGLTYLGFLDLRATPLTLHVGFFCLLMAPEAYAPLRQFAAHYHDRAAARAATAQIAAVFEGLPDDAINTAERHGFGVAARCAVFGAEGAGATAKPLFEGDKTTDDVTAGRAGGAAAGAMTAADVVPVVDSGATLWVKGLTVHAPGRAVPVMNEVSFTLLPGEHVALMGASGSGKTTLLEAISRVRPSVGQLVLDGVPLADWDEARLRERVALIGQKPFLFAGSITANIRLGHSNATDEQVRNAARRACVLEFTDALPAGMETVLGPRGRGLSGGQAQRVALARLFLRDPGLILLDEPTAHLDGALQARVIDEILDFARGRTLLLATHASTVAQRLPHTITVVNGQLESA